jgi:O-antigen/teichoic acid export membrane protein
MSVARRTSWYFASSIGVPLLGLLTLPLYTTRLGPEQFGVFAVGSSLASVVSATAGSVSTLSLPVELNRYEGDDRRRYVGSVLLLAVVGALLSCLVVFAVYSAASAAFDLELLGHRATLLMIAGALLGSLWAICVEIMTIEGRAKDYAITTIIQTVVNAIVVCIALFVFNDIDNALFWGFVGAGAAGAVGAMISLSGRFAFGDLRRWLPVAARGAAAAVLASLTENGKTAVERSYIGLMVGAHQLGLLANGQYYKNASMVLINAVSRGLVPTSLREAKDSRPDFRVTRRLWAQVQALVVAITVGFSLVGREVLGLLTHGKFVEAAPYAVAMMLTLLLQTLAKPHTALMLARGHGPRYANLNSTAIVVALLLMFVTVPSLGVWGAILSFAIQTLALRIALYWVANRIHPLPFSDHWVIGGSALTGLCMLLDYYLNLSLTIRLGLLFVIYLIFLFIFRGDLAIFVAHRKNILRQGNYK